MQDEDKLQDDLDPNQSEDGYEDSGEEEGYESDGEPESEEPDSQDEPGGEDEPYEGDPESDGEENRQQEKPQNEAPKKRDKAQVRINQIRREKYRALHELEQARAEIARLSKQNEVVAQAGVRQYESNVAARLEKARAAQISAIESGDAEAQANANLELAAAANQYHELNNWKSQYEQTKSIQPQEEQNYYAPPPPEHNADILQDWMDDNDWFNPQSERFDQDLSTYINYCANHLDQGLIQSGHQDKIRNSDYFAWIDKLKDDYINQRKYAQREQSSPTQRRELNMRVERGRGPAPARTGQAVYGNQQRRANNMDLSTAEKEIAALCKVSPEAYRRQKLYDQRENAHKRGGY